MAAKGTPALISRLKKPSGGRAAIASREAVRQGGATLNIGLKVGDEVALSADEVLEAVMAAGGRVSEFRIVESFSEPTVVIQLAKPIDKLNLYRLSEGLQQEAIAQRFADGTGEIVGPNAAAWGDFNPEFFRPINYRGVFEERKASALAPVEQAALERRTPAQIAAEEKAIAAGNQPRQAKTPAIMDEIDTPENRARILQLVEQGRAQGGDAWYHAGGVKDHFIDVLGPEQGAAVFDEFMALKAATSPRSTVEQNLRRASVPYQSRRQGGRLDLSADEFPEGTGHMAHSTAHLPSLQRLQETGRLGDPWQQQKITSYFENLRGNYAPVTADTHNFQIWTGHNRSPTAAQYKAIERMQQEMAAELGMDPAEFQSALWAGAGDITGVANTQNITPAMNERVANTARNLGVTEDEAARRFIRGDTRLYSQAGLPAAGIGAGVLATGEENQAMAANPVGPGVRAGVRAAVRTPETFRRGAQDIIGNLGARGIDRETAANRILKDIEELDQIKPGLNQNFTPESKAALREELFDVYGRLQKPEKAGSPAITSKTTDIPATGILDEGRLSPVNPIDGDIAAGDRVWSQQGSTQFDPYAGLDQPGLPHEQMGQIISEGNELSAIAREMSRLPDSHRTNLATGQFIEDPVGIGTSGPVRRYTPEEIAEYEANRAVPHPDKEMMSVGGAAGVAYAIESDARDPGVLADPTLQDDFGRVTGTSMGEALKERNRLPKAAELLQAVPGFLGDMAKHYGRMVGGGLGALATAPMELAASQITTGGLDAGMEALQGRLSGLQDRIPEPTSEDAISQELGKLLSHPQVMRVIEDVMAWDAVKQDEAFEKGRGSYLMYNMATRLPLNL